ncbi:uncharacterized protein [Chiloscyllium punctatum]|uniref:uncharacterized protein n=1 Tax=Chiloscyllium punctatum TaxID=137246 RepID=UPI003B63BD04
MILDRARPGGCALCSHGFCKLFKLNLMLKPKNDTPRRESFGTLFNHPNVQEFRICVEPESTADKCMTMQNQNFSPSKLNDKLPSLYGDYEKRRFPHTTYRLDHTLKPLPFDLEQKKPSIVKQTAHTFELWDQGNPSEMSGRFGFTIYQTSYQGKQETERPFCRRFPKIPSKRSKLAQTQNPTEVMWFGKNSSLYRTPLEILGNTQRPLYPSGKKSDRTKSSRKNCK